MEENNQNSNYDNLLIELKAYEQEHNELNQLLDNEAQIISFDQLTLQRLKKRKLWLKDKIINIKSELYPDIIA